MREVGVSHRGRKKIFCFFCILFYREAFCYFQGAKLFHYIVLKTCTVMCEVIQLLYSNDQYPFNGQMHTGTGSANGQMHTGTGSALVLVYWTSMYSRASWLSCVELNRCQVLRGGRWNKTSYKSGFMWCKHVWYTIYDKLFVYYYLAYW